MNRYRRCGYVDGVLPVAGFKYRCQKSHKYWTQAHKISLTAVHPGTVCLLLCRYLERVFYLPAQSKPQMRPNSQSFICVCICISFWPSITLLRRA